MVDGDGDSLRLPRGTVKRTYLAAGTRSPAAKEVTLDHETWNALLYTVALHSENRPIAIHDVRFMGFSYHIVFTARDPGARDDFVESVARDFTGFLREYTGDHELCFEPEAPILLDDTESQRRALMPVAASGIRGASKDGAEGLKKGPPSSRSWRASRWRKPMAHRYWKTSA